jgi:hypothetical protein
MPFSMRCGTFLEGGAAVVEAMISFSELTAPRWGAIVAVLVIYLFSK